jgi:hypothetical protein
MSLNIWLYYKIESTTRKKSSCPFKRDREQHNTHKKHSNSIIVIVFDIVWYICSLSANIYVIETKRNKKLALFLAFLENKPHRSWWSILIKYIFFETKSRRAVTTTLKVIIRKREFIKFLVLAPYILYTHVSVYCFIRS